MGDYFECKNDYPQLFSDGGLLQDVKAISCIIVQNSKGMDLIDKTKDELKTIEADVNRIQYSHNQAEGRISMKIIKKIVLWVISAFMLLAALVYFPSLASAAMILTTLLTLPIDKWQELLNRIVKKKLKIILKQSIA